MEAIQQLQINNYKSIGQINLECSKINLLIGRPNVGKSNILEALDLFYLPSLLLTNEKIKKEGHLPIDIKEYFRVDRVADMFHLGDISKPVSISTIGGPAYDIALRFNKENESNVFELSSTHTTTQFDNDFNAVENAQYFASPVKPYKFHNNLEFHDAGNYVDVLMPPFGNNLGSVIRHHSSLQEFINNMAEDYGFELIIDKATDNISFQLRIKKGLVYALPYKALADTFRRILFYVAAIQANNASVITLEEPEAHSFPAYVSALADEILYNTKTQFFIATHSPYLLNNLIENAPKEQLSVFVCGYDNKQHETIIRKLSKEDLSELLDYGVDIFFNINAYLNEDRKKNSA